MGQQVDNKKKRKEMKKNVIFEWNIIINIFIWISMVAKYKKATSGKIIVEVTKIRKVIQTTFFLYGDTRVNVITFRLKSVNFTVENFTRKIFYKWETIRIFHT